VRGEAGFATTEDQIACLQDHGLDLNADNITIPDDVFLACFGNTEP